VYLAARMAVDISLPALVHRYMLRSTWIQGWLPALIVLFTWLKHARVLCSSYEQFEKDSKRRQRSHRCLGLYMSCLNGYGSIAFFATVYHNPCMSGDYDRSCTHGTTAR
jgi:hypothetical protein